MAENETGRQQTGTRPPPEAERPGRRQPDEEDRPRKPFYKRPIPLIIIGAIVVAGIIYGVIYWLNSRQYEETDDAFVDGNIVQVSSRVAGQILSVEVDDNQDVAVGRLLVRIDPKDIQARVNQAKATLASAEAKLQAARTNVDLTKANTEASLTQARAGVTQAQSAVQSAESQVASARADVAAAQAESTRRQADLKRYESLDPRVVSQQQMDLARATAESAQANLTAAQKRAAAAESAVAEAQAKVVQAQGALAAAQTAPQQVAAAESQVKSAEGVVGEAMAALDAAELDLSYTQITAPVSGRVTRRTARPGQYLQVGQIAMALVPQDVWVTANFKETQLTYMSRGQDVEITVDAYPGRTFHGKVDSIQAGTGARFSLLPPENATGNYVKVVQRVPVKIVFDRDVEQNWLLGPGMSVVPRVRIGTSGDRHPLPVSPPQTQPAMAGGR